MKLMRYLAITVWAVLFVPPRAFAAGMAISRPMSAESSPMWVRPVADVLWSSNGDSLTQGSLSLGRLATSGSNQGRSFSESPWILDPLLHELNRTGVSLDAFKGMSLTEKGAALRAAADAAERSFEERVRSIQRMADGVGEISDRVLEDTVEGERAYESAAPYYLQDSDVDAYRKGVADLGIINAQRFQAKAVKARRLAGEMRSYLILGKTDDGSWYIHPRPLVDIKGQRLPELMGELIGSLEAIDEPWVPAFSSQLSADLMLENSVAGYGAEGGELRQAHRDRLGHITERRDVPAFRRSLEVLRQLPLGQEARLAPYMGSDRKGNVSFSNSDIGHLVNVLTEYRKMATALPIREELLQSRDFLLKSGTVDSTWYDYLYLLKMGIPATGKYDSYLTWNQLHRLSVPALDRLRRVALRLAAGGLALLGIAWGAFASLPMIAVASMIVAALVLIAASMRGFYRRYHILSSIRVIDAYLKANGLI